MNDVMVLLVISRIVFVVGELVKKCDMLLLIEWNDWLLKYSSMMLLMSSVIEMIWDILILLKW